MAIDKLSLEDEINRDIRIDRTQLANEAATQPTKHIKYIKLLKSARIKMKVAEQKVKRVRRERFLYYIGKSDEVCPTIYEKSEVKTVLEGDDILLEAEMELIRNQERVKLLELTCDAFKSRGFAIKNVIEQTAFENGR